MRNLLIGDRWIGPGHPCFVIAEAGVNHNGDPDLAHRLVDVAAQCGVDAVKFQTFRASALVSPGSPLAEYQTRGVEGADSQLDMLRRYELSEGDFRELSDHCRQVGLVFLSTPFDEGSADLLEGLGVPAFKVPSGELTNLPFLRYLALKGKPLVISTGMASLSEVDLALQAVHQAGLRQYALLHCVSCYPAEPADANLRAMRTLEAAFGAPVGYSDHTLGTAVCLAAVALGATVIEKHFTLDCSMPGPDHRASLEPERLRAMVAGIRDVEASLGHGRKEPAVSEADVMRAARRSLVAGRDIAPGEILSADAVLCRRPGTGLSPALLPHVLGRRARCAISAGSLLSLEMLV